MFNSRTYEQRLASWRNFRSSLEAAIDPLQEVIDAYKKVPLVRFQCDPYDRTTWPSPWEIIDENIYCEFVKILAICYTLQLTERFSNDTFEIHIRYNKTDSSIHYLLQVNDMVIGYDENSYINVKDLPETLISQETFVMQPLQ